MNGPNFWGCSIFSARLLFRIVLFRCFLHSRGSVNFCGHPHVQGHPYFWNFLHFMGHLQLFGHFHLRGRFNFQMSCILSWQNRFTISSYGRVEFWEYLLMCDCDDVYLRVNPLWQSRLTPKRKICTAWKGIKQVKNGNTHYF